MNATEFEFYGLVKHYLPKIADSLERAATPQAPVLSEIEIDLVLTAIRFLQSNLDDEVADSIGFSEDKAFELLGMIEKKLEKKN